MAIFRKKKEEEEDKAKNVNKAKYKVHLYEKYADDTARFIKSFDADRFVDQEDFIPYLKNDSQNFFEVFPQKSQDHINYDKKTLEKKLNDKREEYKRQQEKEVPDVNFKDLDYEIQKLRAQIRAMEFSSNSNYASLGEYNIPEFFFVREGSTFHPVKWDLDTSTLGIPSDTKKKSSYIALRNKENKYPTKDNKVQTATWVFLVLTIIAFSVTMFVGWKVLNTYSESEINQIMEKQVAEVHKITEGVRKEADALNDITSSISDDITNTKGNNTQEKNEGDVKDFK